MEEKVTASAPFLIARLLKPMGLFGEVRHKNRSFLALPLLTATACLVICMETATAQVRESQSMRARGIVSLTNHLLSLDGVNEATIQPLELAGSKFLHIEIEGNPDDKVLKALISNHLNKGDLRGSQIILTASSDLSTDFIPRSHPVPAATVKAESHRGVLGFTLSTLVLLFCLGLLHQITRSSRPEDLDRKLVAALTSSERPHEPPTDLRETPAAVHHARGRWLHLSGQHPLIQAAGYYALSAYEQRELKSSIGSEQERSLELELRRYQRLSHTQKQRLLHLADQLIQDSSKTSRESPKPLEEAPC